MSDQSRFFTRPVYTCPCWTCKHKSVWGPSCKAFPDGIPERILSGQDQHREPYLGDNGIQYERSE